MLRNPVLAVVVVTLYLAIYYGFFLAGYDKIVAVMFLFSPLLVIWMVISLLRFGKYTGTELGKDEDWGYEDRSKDKL
jgi:hypothetical protein